MNKYESLGLSLRNQIKNLVYDYMLNSIQCSQGSEGLRQNYISKKCNLDWDENIPGITQQHHWIKAILYVLMDEGKVERIQQSKKWRLK